MEQAVIAFGLLGSIASIIGAWLSIRHANRARSSAVIAEQARTEIYNRQTNSKFSGILSEAKRVQSSFSKYRLPSQSRTLDGLNHEKDIEEFQNLLLALNENRSKLTKLSDFKFENFYARATSRLDNFSTSEDLDEIKKRGIDLFKILDEIVAVLREVIDEFNNKRSA